MLISQVIKSQNEQYFNAGKCDLQGVTDKELRVLYILTSLAGEIWLVKVTEGKKIQKGLWFSLNFNPQFKLLVQEQPS